MPYTSSGQWFRYTEAGIQCFHENPIAPSCPDDLDLEGVKLIDPPVRGDHLFGDVVKAIETGLENIFRGGQLWESRMGTYNPLLKHKWEELNVLKKHLGHGEVNTVDNVVVFRTHAKEMDEHSHYFGHYSKRLQWHLCEIVCVDKENESTIVIGSATRKWKKTLLQHSEHLWIT
jgi:hypothetical protein